MKVDVYSKIILTLIAIALWGILLQPLFNTPPVEATPGVLDINIRELGGRRVDGTLGVNIEKIHGQTLLRKALPVEIDN